MPTFEVSSYGVYSVRGARIGPTATIGRGELPDYAYSWARHIRIEFSPGRRRQALAPGTVAYVAFLEDAEWDEAFAIRSSADIAQRPAVGRFEAGSHPPLLLAFLPLRDFADVYRILQTERPVYVEFDYFTPAYSGQNYLLAWFVVRSGWEQTGEGGADTSLPSEVEAIMRVLRGVEVTIQPPRGVRDDT